jgi:HAD superfamily hydrolase (TIGR01484 family)
MMRPLSELGDARLRGISVVLTDIDDTVTTEGRLTASAYGALERLSDAGIKVVPITGRPAGWCDHIARMWPVAGVVGENGAFYFVYDRAGRTMRQHFWADAATIVSNRAKLDALAERILREVPGCALASDQPYRIADLAIDFCEDVPPLGDAAIDKIVALFRADGAQAKVSSIHVNGWFGDYDKLTMTKVFLAREFGLDIVRDASAIAFSGDSPNDEPMFAAFPLSIGVANLARQAHRLKNLPGYITRGESGDGFVEFADALLRARG